MTIDAVGTTLGLGSADLKTVVLSGISFVLGMLALIQTIMVFYSGFILLYSGADEERRHEAKMTLLRAALGMVIVGLAWSIVVFLFHTVQEATS
jgi:4-amino-4-deoxy-L-arabinose transferase-like glycosyltransferase